MGLSLEVLGHLLLQLMSQGMDEAQEIPLDLEMLKRLMVFQVLLLKIQADIL